MPSNIPTFFYFVLFYLYLLYLLCLLDIFTQHIHLTYSQIHQLHSKPIFVTRIFLPTLHLCMLGVFLYSCLPRILPTFISPADLTYKLLPAQAHKCMHVHVRMHVRVHVCQVFSLNLGLLSTLKTLISAEQILTTYLLLPDILLKSISMMLYLHCSPPPSCSHLWSLFIMPKQIQTFHSSRS